MRLVKSYEDSSKAVFCVRNHERSKKEFIVINNLDSKDPILALRKRFIVDFLKFLSETEGDVSWADLDAEIASIMGAIFHTI
jgi:hypothetical protein